jgi:23S rRNA (guanosine2251-2'-O)-methyltransferase
MDKFIYGFHSINAYLEQNITDSTDTSNPDSHAPNVTSIETIYIDNSRKDKRINDLVTNAQKKHIPLKQVTHAELDKLCNNNKHQGVVAKITNSINQSHNQVHTLNELIDKIQLQNKPNAAILILDGITDPHNLGAIIRTADCFGVDGIILPQNNSANINNAVVAKTSSGAVKHIPVIMVTNLSRAISTLKQNDFWIFGTSLTPDSISLTEFNHSGKTVWVMGNEGTGLRRLVAENCDYLVNIPMYGNTQSLNVSVATGVILAYTKLMKK